MFASLPLFLLIILFYATERLYPQEDFRLYLYDLSALALLLYFFQQRIRFWQKKIQRNEHFSFLSLVKAARHTSVVRFSLTICGFFFILLWLSRHFLANPYSTEVIFSYRTYFSAALFSFLLAQLLIDRKILAILHRLDSTPGRTVFILYIIAAIIGTFILIMPWNIQSGQSISLTDAFFISISALSVTGLTPVDISEIFTKSGLFCILIMIQVGGLGIVAISAGLAILTRKRLSIAGSLAGKELFDIPDLGNMRRFIGKVIIFTIIVETIGACLLFFSFDANTSDRIFHAIFHSVSAFCNAGFSSFSENLQSPLLEGFSIFTICILILIGSIGFPLIFELKRLIKPLGKYRTISMNSILTLHVTGMLLILGAALFFIAESLSNPGNMDNISLVKQAFFYSISTRTAGFNLIPVHEFSQGATMILLLLMFIGGGSISTAGGIKTNTIGVLITTMMSILRGHKWVQFRHREIPELVIFKAVAIVALYLVFCFLALLLLLATERIDPWSLSFEVVSAMSTVGLSLGATSELSTFGKMIIISVMLTGRLGFMTIVYIGVGRLSEQRFRYPKDHFFVG